MFQERISVDDDSDIIAVNTEKDRWYVKVQMADERGGSSSPSPSNDEDCSDASGASGVGKPCKLPAGILGSREISKAEARSCLKRLLDNADRDGKVAKAERKGADDHVLEQARLFQEKIKAKAKCAPKKGVGKKKKEKEKERQKGKKEKERDIDNDKEKEGEK